MILYHGTTHKEAQLIRTYGLDRGSLTMSLEAAWRWGGTLHGPRDVDGTNVVAFELSPKEVGQYCTLVQGEYVCEGIPASRIVTVHTQMPKNIHKSIERDATELWEW